MTENIYTDYKKTSGNLYIVATPIGNLRDITLRAVDTLKDVDFIAAEDTRVTIKLLNHLSIKKPMISCYRHNEPDRINTIVDRILLGENCALCCDAGTPAISDPGQLLVSKAIDMGIRIIPIPGPSAVISALSSSGLDSGRFCFEGFIPMNKKTRRNRLIALQNEQRTMVFYEAPHKLRRTLIDLRDYLGDREIVIARELTKIYEEFLYITLSEAISLYSEHEPRGEFVVIVKGLEVTKEAEVSIEEAVLIAQNYMKNGLSTSEAAKKAALETNWPRSQIYKEVVGS